jgi:hypothetical protein
MGLSGSFRGDDLVDGGAGSGLTDDGQVSDEGRRQGLDG